ncbi:MAG: T9SS type A sorting domain-containing protein [Bacteroidetes bacterium]|nr:T9SS type A sorting domain-containing protein [Bacteroidota bacterium]
MNAGTMGYIDRELARRRCDWNGESKWDSTAAYINDFLRPIADIIQEDLTWQNSKIWSVRGYPDAGENAYVNEVLSLRQDATSPMDDEDSTFVIISEFMHRTTNEPYLFVLNGRTHPEGQRHITVKLSTQLGAAEQWLVENVATGDIWIVRPADITDTITTANGFTDYFPQGSAGLYRLTPMDDGSLNFLDTCFAHTLTITHGAIVTLANKTLQLAANAAIVVEDSLLLSNCTVSCCDLEGTANIFVRDGGGLGLVGNSILSDESSFARILLSVGPDSRLYSERSHFAGIPWNESVITVVDGYAFTNENAVDLGGGGTFVTMWGNGELFSCRDSVQGNTGFFSYGIFAQGGNCYLERDRFLNVGIPLVAFGGTLIQGSDFATPVLGRNKFRANTMAMYCQDSEIMFGEHFWWSPTNCVASQNSIGVLDPVHWYHASAPTGAIYADANFWGYGSGTPLQACPPNIYGYVSTDYALACDSVPFTGTERGVLSKNSSASITPSPSGIRQTVLQHLANNSRTSARSAMESFLQAGGGQTANVQDLAFLYRSMKQVDAPSLVASLLSICLNRQDLRCKLLASDILEKEGDAGSALSVLDSYSFVGSDTLLRDAFLRKAILSPQAMPGGYARGLAALDTLAGVVAFDSTLHVFIDRYPRLFSNLTHASITRVPKLQQRRYEDILLPTNIDVWPNYPNPFRDVTSFTFKLGEDTHVRLAVYDAMGREVTVVTDADYLRGVHSVVLRSGGLPSGLYFYRLTTDQGLIQRKMLLMR